MWVQVTEQFLHELYGKIERLQRKVNRYEEEYKPKVGLEPTTPALRERCSAN